MEAKTLDLVCLLSERKQNILIWSKNVLIASKSFPFWPKNSGRKQSNLIWSGNCLGQKRMFLYNPKSYRSKQNVLIWSTYYRNESKTFWFGPLIVGTKAKQFAFARVPLTMLLILYPIPALSTAYLQFLWSPTLYMGLKPHCMVIISY